MPIKPDPFMIRAHVSGWQTSVDDYRAASAATRQTLSARPNVRYGDHPDEVMDLYFPSVHDRGEPLPVHMFIHGGYWRIFSKDDYAFVANSITEAGAIAAIVDYSLMPVTRMATLVSQIRRAADWLSRNASSFGGNPGTITASGHSAGAHLASLLVCRGANEAAGVVSNVSAVLLVSGVYDLEPISQSFLQPELHLTPEEVSSWSPQTGELLDRYRRVTLLVGANETAPFHVQASAFQAHLQAAGCDASLVTVPDEDHMTIVRSLGRPGDRVANYLRTCIGAENRRSA